MTSTGQKVPGMGQALKVCGKVKHVCEHLTTLPNLGGCVDKMT